MPSVIKLCSYDDSDDESQEENTSDGNSNNLNDASLKQKAEPETGSSKKVDSKPVSKLPLPSVFLPIPEEPISGLNCRVRTFGHVRGNWASHAFIPFADNEDLRDFRDSFIASLHVESLIGSRLHPIEDDELHLSLSKTFVLAHHTIPAFVQSLTKAVADSGTQTFSLALSSQVRIYFNDEGTRGFLALVFDPCFHRHLQSLTALVDATLVDFNMKGDVYYLDPSFHLSFAWFLPPVRPKETETNGIEVSRALSSTTRIPSPKDSGPPPALPYPSQSPHSPPSLDPGLKVSLEESLTTYSAANLDEDGCRIVVKNVLLKTGNKIHSIPLN